MRAASRPPPQPLPTRGRGKQKREGYLNEATSLLLAGLIAFAASVSLAGPASAETTLITLGTAGGPLPRADRAQSSNLLIVNGTLYLIDAGGGVTMRIVQSGNDFRKVGKIFITHPHSDHDDGLATLLNSEWEYSAPTDRHLRRRRRGAGQRRDRLPAAECRYPLVGRQETADGRNVPRARRVSPG